MRHGLLLVNLGTPEAPETRPVRRYLREFLSDPRVIDVNPVLRAFLLNVVILPRRPAQSAEAYRKIWTERGSPLLFHGMDLAEKVQKAVGDRYHVELAMRYGRPPIAAAVRRMVESGIESIVLFPLFPQYSTSAWGSAVAAVYSAAAEMWNVPSIRVVSPYYDHPAFIAAFAAVARDALADFEPDKVVQSFHGLPERHVLKSDSTGGSHCLQSETCCAQIGPANGYCYRAQCLATARALAVALNLGESDYVATFQSRLGRAEWIRPYTDEMIRELAGKGVRKLAVLCPAFVADCLETIEEIGIRGEADFRAHGGEELRLIPSLNSHDAWVQAVIVLAELARSRSADGLGPKTASLPTGPDEL